jgi:hypothetical protein
MTNVVVDDTHHVTSFHLADGNANIDAINYDTGHRNLELADRSSLRS